MRVAIVHDDLVQWGGAERALQGLCEIFPDAPIYTSVYDKNNLKLKESFGGKKIITSFLQNIPAWKKLYKALLPFYPISFEQFNFDEFDLVISNTTRFAKAIITKPSTLHICYCHTPPRFLWHFSSEFYPKLEFLLSNLRIYDQISSQRVDFYIAGSENAKKRIKKVYKRESETLYPFIDIDRFEGIETFDGGYMLVISRLNKYKRIDLAINACKKLKLPLKIIGVGPQMHKLQSVSQNESVIFLGNLEEDKLIKLLAGCKAVIVPAEEDFGLVSLEAQALGKGVVGYKVGGNMETVVDGRTGILFDSQNEDSLTQAIERFLSLNIDPALCKENANKFSKKRFLNEVRQLVAKLGYTIN